MSRFLIIAVWEPFAYDKFCEPRLILKINAHHDKNLEEREQLFQFFKTSDYH